MKNNVLYIKTISLEDNISLAFNIAIYLNLEYFAIWVYPEIVKEKRKKLLSSFKFFYNKKQMIEPITNYGENEKYIRNKLFRFDEESKNILIKKKKKINRMSDSICFYKNKTLEWYMCSIMHENMIIVKNTNNLKSYLKEKNIEFLDTAPSWW